MSPRDEPDVPAKHRRPHDLPQPLPLPYVISRSEQLKLWTKRYRTEIAASCASLVSTFLTFPLDTIKTRLQTHPYDGVVDCVKQTHKTEHTRGFWRGKIASYSWGRSSLSLLTGVWSPLLSITLVRTFSLSIYQQAKYFFDDRICEATGTSPLVVANTRGAYPNLYTVTCFGASGAVAGAVITFLACPFELTKTAQQLSEVMLRKPSRNMDMKIALGYKGKGTFGTAKQLIKDRGKWGLYSGLSYHLLRDTIGTGVYFMTYESVKQLLANSRGDSPASPTAVIIAGGACGITSWICIFPIDTAKSQYQKNCIGQAKGKTDSVQIKWVDRSKYKGLGISIARSAIINALFFSTFEFAKRRINALEVPDLD